MKRILGVFALAILFVSCQNNLEGAIDSSDDSRSVTHKQMDAFVSDLLSGIFNPFEAEVYSGDTCIKAFDVMEYGTILDKYGNYGSKLLYMFNEDGTCYIGYYVGIQDSCEKDLHAQGSPIALYGTFYWSYDADNAIITWDATKELGPYGRGEGTLQLVGYIEEEDCLLVKGKLPMYFSADCVCTYKCRINTSEGVREGFLDTYENDADYPCCNRWEDRVYNK